MPTPLALRCLAALGFLTTLSACSPGEAPSFEPFTFSAEAPRQTALKLSVPVETNEAGVRLNPRASYQIDAFVMSVRRYDTFLKSDDLGDLVPVDWALAWGSAAAPEVQSELTIRQSARWYFWRTKAGSPLPLPAAELNAGMANVHVIPETDEVRARVLGVESGRCYRVAGQLVDIEGPTPARSLRTSLSRVDSGAGACEIFRVSSVVEIACP